MNRNVFALLVVVILASGPNWAQAETMEERKQRIMRKYMRERQDIMQSDFGVPQAVQEDARVVESEQFKDLAPDFQRQKGAAAPPPMARPVPVQQAERSWWLDTAEEGEDSFANPFSSQTEDDTGPAQWSPWDRRDDASTYGNSYGRQRDRQDDAYSERQEDAFLYGDTSSRQWDERGTVYPGRSPAYGTQSEFNDRSSLSGMMYGGYTTGRTPASRESAQIPGYYGRQQMDTRGGAGWQLDSSGRYNASPSMGFPQSSLPSATDPQGWTLQNQSPGYSPYRSPYETRDDEQRRYGDNFQPRQPQYSRPNNYQKWKDSDPSWDPNAGNPYLDELMRNERR